MAAAATSHAMFVQMETAINPPVPMVEAPGNSAATTATHPQRNPRCQRASAGLANS